MLITNVPQTMKQVYQQIIVQGRDPWVALGDFMNSWYDYHKRKRRMLIKDAPEVPDHPTLEHQKWAVFCAASVEYFCQKYGLSCPDWVSDPFYTQLVEPWYYSPFAHLEWVREELREEAPEPFRRRNIFVSRRIYANKYEASEDLRKRRTA